ncbi:hypothetical protein N473_02865 [Pseudoalteromonas luteoviolacea CPMOR-1]|uniref:DUF1015 domain-containing protein n=1 Tax=Pseudoalteromonas luteoviolacea CPMOR-1 TaxID=1365248 RepID=A0A167ISN8_9GAMM|nr:DUF1015 family protein [Pseudoalteromonas luteoviolacea]KZN59875.1 hypothetical protein N473_02865 [Pseudoalteromonas luteoviolacea CPMOR-1]
MNYNINPVREAVSFEGAGGSYYAYKIESPSGVWLGLLAGVHVNGDVKKHEQIFSDKLNAYAERLLNNGLQDAPITLFYKENNQICQLLKSVTQVQNPDITLTHNATEHRLWQITCEDLEWQLSTLLGQIEGLYVADGHHRLAATESLLCGASSADAGVSVLSALFPDSSMKVAAYNRAVKASYTLDEHEFMDKLERYFDVLPIDSCQMPNDSQQFVMVIGKVWYLLSLKPTWRKVTGARPPYSVDMLEKFVFDKVLGVNDVVKSTDVAFVPGNYQGRAFEDYLRQQNYSVGFIFQPVCVEQIMQLADAGGVLSPHSTWIEPKAAHGLVRHYVSLEVPLALSKGRA